MLEKTIERFYVNSSSAPSYIDYQVGDYWGRLYFVNTRAVHGGVMAKYQGSLCNDRQWDSIGDELE